MTTSPQLVTGPPPDAPSVDDLTLKRLEASDTPGLLNAMQVIRAIEGALAWASLEQMYTGPLHVSLGQEAVAVGLMTALNADDVVFSNHRGHGHALARGVPPIDVLREILTGVGGSMHLFFREHGFLGTNGIVGDNAAIALGPAWAAQVTGKDTVTCVIVGDGAMGTGVVYEAFNLAALWRLPVVFCCEHNGYAEMTPTDVHLATSPVARAEAFGLVALRADGTDVHDVADKAATAVAHARDGQPAFLEARTYRFGGHYVGDPGAYRAKGEDETWRQTYDPIETLRHKMQMQKPQLENVQRGLDQRARDVVRWLLAVA